MNTQDGRFQLFILFLYEFHLIIYLALIKQLHSLSSKGYGLGRARQGYSLANVRLFSNELKKKFNKTEARNVD